MDVVMLCAERRTVSCSATDLVSLFALITTILSSARQAAPEMRYHLHKYPHNIQIKLLTLSLVFKQSNMVSN